MARSHIRLLRALYKGNVARVRLPGEVGPPMALRRGIRQGCPTSGSVWAALFVPVMRRWRRLCVAASPCMFGVFADDTGFATAGGVSSCRIVGATAGRFERGTGLRLHFTKTQVVPLGAAAGRACECARADPTFLFREVPARSSGGADPTYEEIAAQVEQRVLWLRAQAWVHASA